MVIPISLGFVVLQAVGSWLQYGNFEGSVKYFNIWVLLSGEHERIQNSSKRGGGGGGTF